MKNTFRLPTTKELEEDARRIADKRRKELPQMEIDLRKEVRAQARFLKEMEQHQHFCDRIMNLFLIQEELAEDLECNGCGGGFMLDEKVTAYCGECASLIASAARQTFQEFWHKEVPESMEPSDTVSQARLRAVAHQSFEAGKKAWRDGGS